MDTAAYPREDVKKLFGPMICAKINPETSKPGKKVADQFGVDSYPRLMLFNPQGEILHVVKGSPLADHYPEEFTISIWNDMVTARRSEPPDWTGVAKNLLMLTAWFPDTPNGAKAADVVNDLQWWKAYKTAAEKVKAEHDRELLAIKAPALVKLGKKKEAIEAWKSLVSTYPDTDEAKASAAELKKLGVKVEPAPPETKPE